MASPTPSSAGRVPASSVWSRRPELAAVALLLVLVGPLVQSLVANSAPRFAMTAAIVDDGRLAIDGYPLSLDFTTRDGRTYSDKAPLQSLLGVPFYAVARWAGAEPARVPRPDANITLWWVTLFTSLLPLAGIVVLMGGALRRRLLQPSVGLLLTVACGTMLLPLASSLYGHVLAAALGFASWTVLDRSRAPSWSAGLGAGALAGLAVTTEYQAALVGLVLAAWLVLARRWSTLGGFVLGGIPPALLLMAYQWAVTGSVLTSGYQTKSWEGESGFFTTHVTHPPSPGQAVEVLVGSRGLLVFTPIVVVGVVGLVRRWRVHGDVAGPIGLALLAGFLLLQASWANTWGGEGPGARYMAPALPFLAVGVGEVWHRLPDLPRVAIAGVSVLSMGLATVTYHLMPEGSVLVVQHLDALRTRGAVPTLFSIAAGGAGWLLHVGLVGSVVALLLRPRAAAAGATVTVGGADSSPTASDTRVG